MTKSGREIMEIFEAFDLTGTAWSAAQLTGCDAKTVARYVAVRDAGGDPLAKTCKPRLIDAFMPKVEEWTPTDFVDTYIMPLAPLSCQFRARTRMATDTPALSVSAYGCSTPRYTRRLPASHARGSSRRAGG